MRRGTDPARYPIMKKFQNIDSATLRERER